MLRSIIFTVSATLLGLAWILNRILAHSTTPELSSVVAGTFLLGLAGVIYVTVSALRAITEWRESKA